MATGAMRVVGHDLPGTTCIGRRNVHVGLERRGEVVDLVPGDTARAVFTVPIDVVDGDYRGPYVHGPREQRFIYLSWGERAGDGTFTMFRRAKLRLGLLPPTITSALAAGQTVQGELRLTDPDGGPLCASIPPASITWSVPR
jgi:hypothetical protein